MLTVCEGESGVTVLVVTSNNDFTKRSITNQYYLDIEPQTFLGRTSLCLLSQSSKLLHKDLASHSQCQCIQNYTSLNHATSYRSNDPYPS